MIHALAAWSGGIVSACGVMGCEIESRQGIHRVLCSFLIRRQPYDVRIYNCNTCVGYIERFYIGLI
jgi:hypothetical protein